MSVFTNALGAADTSITLNVSSNITVPATGIYGAVVDFAGDQFSDALDSSQSRNARRCRHPGGNAATTL